MNYKIKTKYVDCAVFDTWITKLEMSAFGWRHRGSETIYSDTYDLTIDYDNNTATMSRRFTTYTLFKRVTPYTFNVFYVILETLMRIFSWIRRKLIYLFAGLTIILLVIGVLGSSECLIGAAVIVAFIYGPSLFFALLGFVFRKALAIERKLEDSLEKNGYAREQDF